MLRLLITREHVQATNTWDSNPLTGSGFLTPSAVEITRVKKNVFYFKTNFLYRTGMFSNWEFLVKYQKRFWEMTLRI